MAPGTPRDTASGALPLPSDIGTQEAAQTGWTPNRTDKWQPEKYFKRVMLPELVREDSLDIMTHLVEWAPARLNAIEEAIEEIDTTFDLVMIAERMGESLVLLADLLCIPLQDVATLKEFRGAIH